MYGAGVFFRSKIVGKKRHRRNQRIHFASRLREHFGIVYNEDVRKDITKIIYSGLQLRSKSQVDRRTAYEIAYRGHRMIVIFDWQNRELATVLPPDVKFDELFNFFSKGIH